MGDLGKLIFAKGFEKLPKVKKNCPIWSHCRRGPIFITLFQAIVSHERTIRHVQPSRRLVVVRRSKLPDRVVKIQEWCRHFRIVPRRRLFWISRQTAKRNLDPEENRIQQFWAECFGPVSTPVGPKPISIWPTKFEPVWTAQSPVSVWPGTKCFWAKSIWPNPTPSWPESIRNWPKSIWSWAKPVESKFTWPKSIRPQPIGAKSVRP